MVYLHSLAPYIQERLDVEVVGSQDDFEQHLLIDGNELLVPLRDVRGSLSRLFDLVGGRSWVASVMATVLQDLGMRREQGSVSVKIVLIIGCFV